MSFFLSGNARRGNEDGSEEKTVGNEGRGQHEGGEEVNLGGSSKGKEIGTKGTINDLVLLYL